MAVRLSRRAFLLLPRIELPKRSQTLTAPAAIHRLDAWRVFLRCRDLIICTPTIGAGCIP